MYWRFWSSQPSPSTHTRTHTHILVCGPWSKSCMPSLARGSKYVQVCACLCVNVSVCVCCDEGQLWGHMWVIWVLRGKLSSDDRCSVWLATLDTHTSSLTHTHSCTETGNVHQSITWLCLSTCGDRMLCAHTHTHIYGRGCNCSAVRCPMDENTCSITTLILAQVFITYSIMKRGCSVVHILRFRAVPVWISTSPVFLLY